LWILVIFHYFFIKINYYDFTMFLSYN
jgi:hypothetical protein